MNRSCYRIAAWLLVVWLTSACNAAGEAASAYLAPTPDPTLLDLLAAAPPESDDWSQPEIELLRSLWIGNLPPPPVDPSNAVADDPRAAALGHRLFFDKRLSANNQVACATCHLPELYFTDGLPTAHGTHPNPRHTMTIVGAAYAPWLLWDGHKESLWAQAVEPIEAIDEQGATRLHAVHLMANDERYRRDYEAIFGPLPALDDYARFPDSGGPVDFLDYRERWETMRPDDQDAATRVFVNMGKSIAAYERLIYPAPARFDQYVRTLLDEDTEAEPTTLNPDEIAGLRLFIGAAGCLRCHNGPLFSDFQFHNTGVPAIAGQTPDAGRSSALEKLAIDEFRCAGAFSDDLMDDCPELENVHPGDLLGAFRTPMLRNVAATAPFMHAGQLASLSAVVEHYKLAPTAAIGKSELNPLELDARQWRQLEAFLLTLNAPPEAPGQFVGPAALSSNSLR
ncbi:MAG: cytochrome-c peroxidase [Caldilineaceae bacterium]|nr:cytochrome-c peroxidase [Caldilineaceae bacterium]